MNNVNDWSFCCIAEHHRHSVSHLTPLLDAEYHALVEKGFLAKEKRGILRMSGNEALSLLDRLSTNDLTVLDKGQNTCTTVLTTEKAKLVDLITVVPVDTKILVLTSADNQHNVKTWLEKYIIMEDVQVLDVTSEYAVYTLYGTNTLSRITSQVTSAHAQDASESDREQGYVVFANSLWKAPVFTLVSGVERSTRFEEEAMQSDSAFMETLRVENGIPIYGKELTGDVNPLEAGLGQYISFTKGCYIGQEVIARIDTYGRLHKKLVGIVFNERDETLLNAGKLHSSSNEVGYTTSHVWSPVLHNYIALGYLNNGVDTSDINFSNDDMRSTVLVSVSPLPFDTMTGNRG